MADQDQAKHPLTERALNIVEARRGKHRLPTEQESLWLIAEALLEITAQNETSIAVQSRIASALEEIEAQGERHLASLAVRFSAADAGGTPAMADVKKDSAGTGTFDVTTGVSVKYQIEGQDQNGNAIAFPSDAKLALVSNDGNAIVTPDPNDPTGATGTVTCPQGFTGPVGGTGTITDSEGDAENVTWSGQFDPQAAKLTNLVVVFSN